MKVIIKRNRGTYSMESEIDIDEIKGVHWDNVSGGVNQRQAGYSLYGYIDYKLASQIVSCSGTHAHYGRPAKIMIPASLNKREPYKSGYEYLVSCIVPKPVYHYRWPCLRPCTKRILELLGERGFMSRKDLREVLIMEKYGRSMIARALNRMEKAGRIVYKEGNSYSSKQIIALGNVDKH